MNFLSYHFYIYFKIEGYNAAVLSKECAWTEQGIPGCDKNLTPTPYSLQGVRLVPFLTQRYGMVQASTCIPSWEPLGNALLPLLLVLPCHHFSLHLSWPLTRESSGNVCAKNREQAGSAKIEPACLCSEALPPRPTVIH